jgi:hypothetical protein
MNFNIDISSFNHNARTGLVWGGGVGLTVNRCDFNYTGVSRLTVPEASGVDIEFEASNVQNRGGTFTNCNFKNNIVSGIISDPGPPPFSTLNYSRDVVFSKCTFVSSSDGVSAWPTGLNFSFQNSWFYGPIWAAVNAAMNSANGVNIHDNAKFNRCHFFENYTDPEVNPSQIFSHGMGVDEVIFNTGTGNWEADPLCPMPVHHFLIDFTTARRVSMTNCEAWANFTLNIIQLSTTPVPGAQVIWNANVLDNNYFWDNGTNQCACDHAVTSITLTNLITPNFFYHPNYTNIICPVYTAVTLPPMWNDPTNKFESGSLQNPIYSAVGSPCAKYIDPIYPNHLSHNDLFHCPDLTVAATFPAFCFSPRLASNHVQQEIESSEIDSIIIYPNPTSNSFELFNLEKGTIYRITNNLGEVLVEGKVKSNIETINLEKYNPGIYFIITDKKSLKIIKS